MPYGAAYWQRRASEGKRKERDARRGGMIAYSRHEEGRLVFVEEIVSAREVRGHGLKVGRELFGRMVEQVAGQTQEIHLLVEAGNAHACALYEALGFETKPWRIWEPREDVGERYLVATVGEVARRLAEGGRPTHVVWEVESALSAGDLRGEDREWATRMYEEAHKREGKRWAQHHATQANHVLVWDAAGVRGRSAAQPQGDSSKDGRGGSPHATMPNGATAGGAGWATHGHDTTDGAGDTSGEGRSVRVQTCAVSGRGDVAAAKAATAHVAGDDGADAEGGRRPDQSAGAATTTDAAAAAAAGGTGDGVTAPCEGWRNGGGVAAAATHNALTAQRDLDWPGDDNDSTMHADIATGGAGAETRGRGMGATADGTTAETHEMRTHTCGGRREGDAATAATTQGGATRDDGGDGAPERTAVRRAPTAEERDAGAAPGARAARAAGGRVQHEEMGAVAAAEAQQQKKRRERVCDARPTREDGVRAAARRRTQRDDGASTSGMRRDEPGQDGKLEVVAALPVRCGEEGERQQRSSAGAARRRARGSGGGAAQRGDSARDAYDGDLEEVAASAAAATRNRPGAPSGVTARAEQHAQRDDDARRATRQRGGDDSAAAAEAAAEERAGERRSNRQRAGLAAAPRDSEPCELASELETQDASQHSRWFNSVELR